MGTIFLVPLFNKVAHQVMGAAVPGSTPVSKRLAVCGL